MPRQFLHGVSTIDAVPAAARARVGQREEALAVGDDAAPVAVRARPRRGARLGARAAADVAGGLDLDGHAHLHALRGRPRTRSARATRGRRRARGAAGPARWPRPKNEPKLPSRSERSPRSTFSKRTPPGPNALRALRAVAVVRLALLVVREDVVGGLDVLEPLLGGRVVRVPVGMELARELAVRLLDLVVGRRLRDAEDVVRDCAAATRLLLAPLLRHDDAGGPQHGVADPVAALHDLHDVARARRPRPAAPSAPRGRAGRTARRRGSPRPPRRRARRRGRPSSSGRPRAPSTSSWCSAASSARSRSSSTGSSFATTRSPERARICVCSRATRLR